MCLQQQVSSLLPHSFFLSLSFRFLSFFTALVLILVWPPLQTEAAEAAAAAASQPEPETEEPAESPVVTKEEAPTPMEEVTPQKEEGKSDDLNADIKADVVEEDEELDEKAPETPAIHLYTKKTKTAKVKRRAWSGFRTRSFLTTGRYSSRFAISLKSPVVRVLLWSLNFNRSRLLGQGSTHTKSCVAAERSYSAHRSGREPRKS